MKALSRRMPLLFGASLIVALTIAAACGDKSTHPPFTTVTDTIATITLTPANPTVPVGSSLAFTALIANANGDEITGRVIQWTSSRGDVAHINEAGLLTALEPGTTTITATAEADTNAASNERKTGTTLLTVVTPVVTNVFILPPSATIVVGGTVQLNASPTDAQGNVLTGKTVLWSSSVPTVLSVNASGLVTALARGTATIYAQVDGVTGSATIVVPQ